MNIDELKSVATSLVLKSKGILAADESTGTIEKRLTNIGIISTEQSRRDWRELLFTTIGIGDYISGVILFDETIRQTCSDGRSMVQVLQENNVIAGIKVDKGAKLLSGASGETVTEGLDGLRDRLNEYRELGAKFTKWRAMISITDSTPTQYCLNVNAHALARYAALSQEAGLVPIVEPEVLMDGSHDINRCLAVTKATLTVVFKELRAQNVMLEGILLKPNMVISGKESLNRANAKEVADATLRCFQSCVPTSVPGIVFLSGGQTDEDATINLNAINKRTGEFPWEMSFSYGRGLQATPLKIWAGKAENIKEAQDSLLVRAKLTSAARDGNYLNR